MNDLDGLVQQPVKSEFVATVLQLSITWINRKI